MDWDGDYDCWENCQFCSLHFAPTALVTPLGALSIIVKETDENGDTWVYSMYSGSTLIVLHAPSEHSLSSVKEIWELAT
ncbi:hypothetical protein PVL29_022958 [Vitis rotundifolia]|uniref:Uncharacterized protein n=1 Tax=Vitis rotundifolia TaxID=103349 RepID=A0AA38YXA8_VITRO|nr:hypothetical protein PVL29_022958 [Vitis rotundifolia]